jgi:hypothetical protein
MPDVHGFEAASMVILYQKHVQVCCAYPDENLMIAGMKVNAVLNWFLKTIYTRRTGGKLDSAT